MTLEKGTRLGPYELLTLIGEGGMGQVYRGRDTRLGRTVAIKVLSARADVSPERRARFEREARAISALSHPHICPLFDVGVDQDIDYLVMEHLEGETLASRLGRGPLPLEEVLQYGRQMADALELAHRTGVIHRDLKPGNVLVTASGIRLLDFGLAKLHSGADVSVSPETMAGKETELAPPPLTVEGAVFGTPQYMAPEQLEGRAVDARADLWAFGCVLYEMATGARPFDGVSLASTMAAILGSVPEPPSARLKGMPPALERLILHCLVKDPARRWQSALDARLQLDAITAGAPDSAAATPEPARRLWPWIGAVGLIGAALAGVWIGRQGGASVAHPAVRFEVPPPPGTMFLAGSVEVASLAVSPDGTRLAFVGVDLPGTRGAEQRPGASVPGTRLWLRRVDDLEAEPIAGTEGATSLMWSADGRSLGFFASGKLRRVDTDGGTPVTICDVPPGIGYSGTWGAAGAILFASVQGDAIYSVSATGGTPTRILELDAARHESRLVWPQFLPDGRGYLYWSRSAGAPGTLMLSDGGGAPRPVPGIASRASFIGPDWLVFARDGALLAQHFDRAAGTLTGAPVSIAPRVRVFASNGWAGFAASPAGSLIYLTGQTSMQLHWVDRSGAIQGTVGTPGDFLNLSLSPDGRSLLADRASEESGTYDLWKFDLDRNVTTKLTDDQDADFAPIWLPGTNSFVYSTIKASVGAINPNLMIRNLDEGHERPLVPRNAFQLATDASLDGRRLVFTERDATGQSHTWALDLTGNQAPTELFPDKRAVDLRFSPDGRYATFLSEESGQSEAYVAAVSGSREAVRISQHGARVLRWRHDGSEILFLSPEGRMMSVSVRTDPSLVLGRPESLFALPDGAEWVDFDVTRDGRRIIAAQVTQMSGTAPASVVVGWTPGGGR